MAAIEEPPAYTENLMGRSNYATTSRPQSKFSGTAAVSLTSNSLSYFTSGLEKIADLVEQVRKNGREAYDPVVDDFLARWKGVLGTRGELHLDSQRLTRPAVLRLYWPVDDAYSKPVMFNLSNIFKEVVVNSGSDSELIEFSRSIERAYDVLKRSPQSMKFQNSEIPWIVELMLKPGQVILSVDAREIEAAGIRHLDNLLRSFNDIGLNGAFGSRWDVAYEVVNVDIDVD